MPTYAHDRAYYRIQYPLAARPKFVPADTDRAYPVVDCCERGLRFAPDGEQEPVEPGAWMEGEVRFRDGDTVPVGGVVVRVQGGEVAVHLNRSPIPLKRILDEQIFLRRRYPFLAA